MESHKMKSNNLTELTSVKNIDISMFYQEKKKSYKRYLSNEDTNVIDMRDPASPRNNIPMNTPKSVTVPIIFFSQLSFNDGTILGIIKILLSLITRVL